MRTKPVHRPFDPLTNTHGRLESQDGPRLANIRFAMSGVIPRATRRKLYRAGRAASLNDHFGEIDDPSLDTGAEIEGIGSGRGCARGRQQTIHKIVNKNQVARLLASPRDDQRLAVERAPDEVGNHVPVGPWHLTRAVGIEKAAA